MHLRRIAISLLVSALPLALVGCGFYHEKSPGDPNSVLANTVGWDEVYAAVFQPRCDLCHSAGGAGFKSSNYQTVVDSISQVEQRALTRQSMPPDSPLTPYEQALLQAWIDEGSPPPYDAP